METGIESTTWHDQVPTHPKMSPQKAYFQKRFDAANKAYNLVIEQEVIRDDWWRKSLVPAIKALDDAQTDLDLANDAELNPECQCQTGHKCVTCRAYERYVELQEDADYNQHNE